MQPASLDIWDKKYRLKDKSGNPVDADIEATYARVAKALADIEAPAEREAWYDRFLWAISNGAIPAGRITSNAGAAEHKPATSTINCTVSDTIPDSMDGILHAVHEAGLTLKAGCGIGYEFSTLRPKGAYVSGAGAYTSGPMSFMDIFDKMCFTVSSAGGRRGAQMGTFDISHPDAIDFIRAKREAGRLRQFNLSCLITKDFMEAVKADTDWDLVFPASKSKSDTIDDSEQVVWRHMPHVAHNDHYVTDKEGRVACRVYKTIKARRLWDVIMSSTYDYAEPGFILIDRVNEMNNNWFCEDVRATNPCVTGDTLVSTSEGEIPIRDIVAQYEAGRKNLYAQGMMTPNDRKHRVGQFPLTEAFKTKENAELVKIETENGYALRCTPDHRIFSETAGKFVEAADLQPDADVLLTRRNDGLIVPAKVTAVITLAEREDVYDVTVFDVHNFFANGILIHNCGEQPLPPLGACLLGSINLTMFVTNPFTKEARFDWSKFQEVVHIFTRMLDNVVEINGLPLHGQQNEIMRKRRHGMGYLGLGSALAMLGIKYGSPASLEFTERLSFTLASTGFKAGVDLAREKGCAPIFNETFTVDETIRTKMLDRGFTKTQAKIGKKVPARDLWLGSKYMQALINEMGEEGHQLLKEIKEYGCRFTHHSSIAPTGTISLSLANNASNGIEPSFAHHYARNVIREGKKTKEKVDVFSFELLAYRHLINENAMPFSDDPESQLPDYFISADDVTPKQHVDVQAAAQKWIDSSISKTANVPTDFPYEDFKDIYLYAYEKGLKGCTTFRFNPEFHQGVLVKEQDLANTTYRFKLEDGSIIEAKGNDEVEYDGEMHTAANLFDALSNGFYGKF